MAMIDYTIGTWDANTGLASSVSANAVSSVSASTIVDLGAAGKDGWGNSLSNQLGGELRFNVNVQTASLTASCVLMIELCTHSATASFKSNAKAVCAVAIPYNASSTSHLGMRRSVGVPSHKFLRYVAPRGRAIGAKANSGTIDCWLGFGEDDSQGGY